MVTVAVIGHRGMLGRVVAGYWAERGATVLATPLRYDGSDALPRWAAEAGYVIDCASAGDYLVDAFLPHHLAAWHRSVIVPGTDAIHEADAYARAKRIAERAPAIVIRSGLVDIGRQPPTAYTDWWANPLTPLEWAEASWAMRDEPHGLYQLGREPVSRYEIASLVAEVFGGPAPRAAASERGSSRILARTTRVPLRDALVAYRDWLRG